MALITLPDGQLIEAEAYKAQGSVPIMQLYDRMPKPWRDAVDEHGDRVMEQFYPFLKIN